MITLRENTTSSSMCGYYSVTEDRIFEQSDSKLRFFKIPKVPLNLKQALTYGIKNKPNSYFDEKMDNILKFIVNNKNQFRKNSSDEALIPDVKFITYRGVILQIMCSCIFNYYFKELCILATKYKGNIYLSHYTKPDKRTPDTENRAPYDSYGHVFKNLSLSDDPSKNPDTLKTIDASSQFFAVFKRKLAGRNFLFAAEMDGVLSNRKINLENRSTYSKLKFVTLKVARSINGQNHLKHHRAIKIMVQSYLVDVKDIFIGYRDDNGVVHDIYSYKYDTLNRIFKMDCEIDKCLRFLEQFLENVENKMANVDDPHTVYMFNINSCEPECEIHVGETPLSILPLWYREEMNKH